MTQIRILAAACGLIAVLPAMAQPSDACSLLPRGVVESAVGTSVGPGRTGIDNRVASSCSFPIKGAGSVSVLVRRSTETGWIAAQQQRMNRGVQLGTYRSVDGLGEPAFVFDMQNSGAALCVFHGNSYLQVSIFDAGRSLAVLPAVERLTRAALARLEFSTGSATTSSLSARSAR